MPLKYACFVSYAHAVPENLVLPPFIRELTRCLQTELDLHIATDCTVFVDHARLRPGYLFPEALAQAMCESACWIMVFAPSYAERVYCRREYQAMLELERRRRAMLGGSLRPGIGMIIPILLRGRIQQLPPEIRDSVHVETRLGDYQMGGGRLHDNATFVTCIRDIVATIYEVWQATTASLSVAHGCSDYRLPQDDGPWSFGPGGPTMRLPGRD